MPCFFRHTEVIAMLELMGMAAIVSVVTASFLIALFAGEALISWIIRAMDAAVKHADEAAKRINSQPQTARLLAGQRVRTQRV